MKLPLLRFALALVLMGLGMLSSTGAEPSKAEVEGRALVADLLAQQPAENSEWRGVLSIRGRDRKTTTIPITGRIVLEQHRWKIVYATSATNKIVGEVDRGSFTERGESIPVFNRDDSFPARRAAAIGRQRGKPCAGRFGFLVE